MTKQQLIEENQKYRRALERILDASRTEGRIHKQIVEHHITKSAYPYIVGTVEAIAEAALRD